jgi:hypothetical protein
MGVLLWSLVCVGLTLHAVSLLKLPPQKETLVLLIAISEMLITLSHVQTNPILLALIIYAFVAFERKSPFWAAACILLGFHIKIFALAAGGFMLLHPRSIPKFIASSVFWFALIGALPLIFIPLEELLWQYQEWVKVLFADLDMQQEISLTGLINVTIGQYDSLNLGIQLVGMCVVCATFMQSELRNHLVLRHICLSAILIWVVIFNHAAESPTYVIALFGIGIWLAYQPQKMDRIVWILFGITLVLSLLSPMDFFPRIIREKVVEPYSLKALGPSLIWMYLIWELWVKKDKYLPRTNPA